MKRRNLVLLGMLAVAITATAASADTSIKPYVVPVGNEYEVKALFSVGDTVPWAKGSGQYRMVGIPDGLGAHANGDGTTTRSPAGWPAARARRSRPSRREPSPPPS